MTLSHSATQPPSPRSMNWRNIQGLSSGARSRGPLANPSCAAPDLSGPLALPEYGHASAVCESTVDVNFIRADHPVDMDQALVAALRGDLLRRQLATVDEAFRIALAERDVAGGVLVEQCVEEQ